MALPEDMQTVQVILFKSDVENIDKMAQRLRQSRSEFLRALILDGLVSFLPSRSVEGTKESSAMVADPVAK